MADNSHRAKTAAEPERPLAGAEGTAGWDETSFFQPALVVRSNGELRGRSLELRLGTQVLGREPGCELRLDDGFVSRRHAVVVRDREAVWIEDAGSANGSSLNGEPLTPGRRRPLRSGDLLRVGRIDLVYLDGSETAPRRAALLEPPAGAPPIEVLSRSGSDDTPLLRPPVTPTPGPTEVAASPLSPVQLALSATAASVTALVLARFHVDQLNATASAALVTVVTTVLQTRGRLQWLRVAGGAGLALVLAVAGITVPEFALGRSLTDSDRPATFVPSALTPQAARRTEPRAQPGILPTPGSVTCDGTAPGQEVDCMPVTIQSTGSAPLRVVSLELIGSAHGEFQVDGSDCQGRPLERGESCTVGVRFRPTQTGPRSAALVVHQNLPRPDTGTQVGLTGDGLGDPTTTVQP
jgi:FHA domain